MTCTEEVYDLAAAQAFAATMLTQKAQQDVRSAYQLNGHVVIDVEEANTQILLNVRGIWAYVFTSARLKQLATVVVGKSQASAQAFLLQQQGIANVQVPADTLPSADHIQIKMQSPAITSS